jgi:transposase
MRPHGTPEELERRRRRAIALLKEGHTHAEVAKRVGASTGSVQRWKDAWKKGGDDSLRPTVHPGPTPKLTPAQRDRLVAILLKGAQARGYPTELWTLGRVAQVVRKEFHVRYHPGHLWRVLGKMGWSCQKPERLARERDEEAVRQWRLEKWPDIKKRKRRGP